MLKKKEERTKTNDDREVEQQPCGVNLIQCWEQYKWLQ